ncbi:MAG: efflux RND transporter permease subunit [Deferribacterales bacterium]|nr:efflux RND transporter permease subunit [Deferribacterales bacterium]
MSSTGGFEMWVQNRVGDPIDKLYGYVQAILAEARKNPALTSVTSMMSVSSPQLVLSIDREKTMSMGVNISDVFALMQSNFGKYYVNDFNMYGKAYRVYAQADAEFRATPDDLKKLYVRSRAGDMIPVSEFVTVEEVGGANTIERFNGFPSGKIMGSPAPGYSSGEAMEAIEAIAEKVLPDGYTTAWSGSAYQERETSSGTTAVLILAMVMVFLILAAQYESWSLPLAVILSVPFAILGAGLATYFFGYSNDIYFQVALVTLIGLSAKNAILIVEFAVEKYRTGTMSIMEAAEVGARLRFRPIIMTSLAFIFGCLPLALSSGAGAASRNVLGTAVVSGMIFATVFAPIFIPYFFKAVMSISTRLFPAEKDDED